MLHTLLAALALTPACGACALEPSGRLGEIVEAAWQASAQAKQETEQEKRDRQRLEEDLKADVEIGKKASAEVDKEFKASKNQEYIEQVARISKDLADVANVTPVDVLWGDKRLARFEYVFKVIESKEKDDQVNAFSLPGGYIYVFEGLIKYAESDHELAGVLAHEIAHASLRHLATLQREANKLQLIQLPAILAAIFSGGRVGGDLMILTQLVGVAKGSGWSQSAEMAADYAGFQYMAKSAYNPVGMLTFMERLARDKSMLESAFDWGIYRTHPPTRERAEALSGYLQKAEIPIRRSLVSTTNRTVAKATPEGKVELHFGGKALFAFAGEDAKARADRAAERLNAFFDTVPELYEVSFTDEGEVVGRREVLFRITDEDASAAKKSVSELSAETIKALKRAMFLLAYRIWDAR
jgi:beta-barrel assembly-enhancing protease